MQPVLSMESLLLKSANGEKHSVELEQFTASVFKDDLSIEKLDRELAILVDEFNVDLPHVERVTSIHTICEEMRAHANRQMLSEVHKLLRLYLTIPNNLFHIRTKFLYPEMITYIPEIYNERKMIK